MSKEELDEAIVSFFRLYANAPQAFCQAPLQRTKGWRSQVLREACKLVTSDEWSVFSTLLALISKGPPAKGLNKSPLPKDLDGEAYEGAKSKMKCKTKAA